MARMQRVQNAESRVPAFVVVGELNVDLILEKVNALPQLGKERVADAMTLALGSSSAILAANASAVGMDVGMIARAGRDIFGRFVIDCLRARGVDTRHVRTTPDVQTGLTAVYTQDEDRGAVTYPGAMEDLTLNDIPWSYLREARHLHLSSYFLQTGLRPQCVDLFRRAKEFGLTTSIDTNWDPDESWGEDLLDVLAFIDVFLPNEHEARLITREDDLDRAMEKLSELVQIVVVTCGADGVRAREGSELHQIPAVEVQPVDAVGAGDSFNAGFLYQLLQGESLECCLQFGAITGAYSTLSAGGTAAFDDVNGFVRFAEDTLRSRGWSEDMVRGIRARSA